MSASMRQAKTPEPPEFDSYTAVGIRRPNAREGGRHGVVFLAAAGSQMSVVTSDVRC